MSATAEEAARQSTLLELCTKLQLDSIPVHFEEALTHPSHSNEQRRGGTADPDNQRLEFLGDAVLSLCVSELLMEVFVDVDEGALTLMRARLVNTRALASVARDLELAEALRLGRGADAAGERHRTNVLADALEAVFGAVYLDCGLPRVRQLSKQLLGRQIAELVANGGMERDPKSRLQEKVQARGFEAPRYEVVGMKGPPHKRTFTVRVDVPIAETEPDSEEPPPSVRGEGRGPSKKLAEQVAARAALEALDATSRSGSD